jgi:hypothetical protein
VRLDSPGRERHGEPAQDADLLLSFNILLMLSSLACAKWVQETGRINNVLVYLSLGPKG